MFLPIGLAYLAGYLRKSGIEVVVVDAYGEAIEAVSEVHGFVRVMRQGLTDQQVIARIPCDVDCIGISAMYSADWPMIRQLIRAIRRSFPSTVLIAGGEHVTVVPEFCLRDAPELDFVVLGEGEKTTVRLLKALSEGREVGTIPALAWLDDGRLMMTDPPQRLRKLDELSKPAWDLFPTGQYFRHGNLSAVMSSEKAKTLPLIASRGCPYACAFCASIKVWGRLWVVRDPEEVVDEIQDYIRDYGVTNFDFYDQAGMVKKSWIIRFCKLLLERQLSVVWHIPAGTRLEALDQEVLRLMKQSGCGYFGFPLESGSDRSLRLINKQLDKQKALQTLRWIVDAHLKTKIHFVLGFPDDTWKDVLASYRVAILTAWIGAHDASFFPFFPAPGSPLFERLLQEKRVELNDDFFITLTPYESMSSFKSYCPHISDRTLGWLCFIGMAMFYAISFLRRPQRAWSLIREIYTRESESRLGWYLVRSLKSRNKGLIDAKQ
ncbi:MAG: cobalamin B12-binding domain-containing protein [Gammaproteobacteria bacterium]|nr:cobalamin B12-binding domain-containing protein [Gammaproteobacteria bacterium]